MAKTSTITYSPIIEGQPLLIKTKRASVYVRCSSEEAKKEGYSPEIQEEKLKEFIKNNNWSLEEKHIYKDIGYSGGTDKRPELQRLLTDARNREFEIILVYRLDRFFRRLRLLENTLSELINLGVGVKSITEPWADYSNPSSKLSLQILGAVAEWQREITLGSRNEGMVRAMKEGKWLGGTAPYGYKINKSAQKLEINKKEVSVVKMIFRWLVEEKLSEYKIQQRINSMKVPTKFDILGRKKKTGSQNWWNRRAIGRMLRSEIYTGVFYYRRYKYLGRIRGENNLRPKEEWIKIEDQSLKIISRAVFDRAQLQLKKNKELSPRNTKQVYILQHKITCGFDGYHYQCARRVYHSKKRDSSETKYYFCTGNRSYFTPKKCTVPTISESRIVPPVWDKLKEILTNPDIIMQELESYISQKGRKNKIEGQLKNIKNAINSSNTKKERYAELYAESSITKEFYDEKVRGCEMEIEDLQKKEGGMSQLLLTESEKEKRIGSVKKLYSRLKESLNNATYEIKREVLQRLVEKVVKTGERLDIEFNIPFESNSLQPAVVGCSDSRRMDRDF